MTRATSRAAFRELDLPAAQRAALDALRKHGPCTAMELEQWSGLRHVNKRTSELRDAGRIHEHGRRRCAVTGKGAIVWAVGEGERAAPEVRTAHVMVGGSHICPTKALQKPGDTCGECGRYVARVDMETIGGVVSRVITTYPGDK